MDPQKFSTTRRNFLTTASAGGLVLAHPARATVATAKAPEARGRSVAHAPHPALEIAPVPAPAPSARRPESAGAETAGGDRRFASDYMVDCLKALDLTTISEIPGSTFAALQESIIHAAGRAGSDISMLTVTHEEIGVAFAHGYAKASGKIAAALVHSTVGLQHASMAIYNAWCDRAPVVTLAGSLTNPVARDGFVDWLHSVSDGPGLTRDFTKFDETPRSLPHFASSLTRAYRMAATPPCGPVVLALDLDLQEEEIPAGTRLPPVAKPVIIPPQGEAAALLEAAKILAGAKAPVILVDRAARTPQGLALMVELAELLQAAVVDMGGRMNFPWRHPLNQTSRRGAALREADVVLALEVQDMAGQTAPARKARKLSISTYDYYLKANYQAFEELAQPELAIAGDAEASLPTLIAALRSAIPAAGRTAIADRGARLAAASAAALVASRDAAAVGWDRQPITTARMYAEVYDQIRDKDWALLNAGHFQSFWGPQLWNAKHYYQYIGDSGAYGLGYLPGAAVGAAYACKAEGRLPIVFGGDGDFMMTPGALWTAAFHQIPLLYIIHNNGGYHQEKMKVQLQANERDRGVTTASTGCVLPGLDYAVIARGMGVAGQRVTDPADLRGAIKRALDVVSRGEPALIDVVSQGR
ncbi:thiamine pyrophosphate-binding protein [Novosphingobium sp. KACC 22771]|uniref:thiamine pyrophosphate-binding protein n=1 Tax=Novosphingobium sp. KACC 22771 TaxID=3025670 RepID=UPI002366CEAB|nr:thiamine pyrophosphate-dependent enzyme [Novosphingobium sp. KACC 22771]WDF75164.1 thiamine pyrophosphate-binding protein [Novosphingobium sp. KACC 22771]